MIGSGFSGYGWWMFLMSIINCRKQWMQMQLAEGSKYINPVLRRWPSMWCRMIMKLHFSVVFTVRKQMKIITSGKGRSSRKIHECGVKPCWCDKSRSACCIPYAEMMGPSVFAGNTRMYISKVIQKRYVVCCSEFDVENEEMLWSSERFTEVVLHAEILDCTNVSICLTFALNCRMEILCLPSSFY